MSRESATLAAMATAAVLGLSACGGGGKGGQTTGGSSQPAGTATTPAKPPQRGGPAPSQGGRVPGGEQPARLAATFTVRDGKLEPATVSIPPFVAAHLSVRSADGRGHVVVVRADRRYRLAVPAGGRATLVLPGQRPGRYPVLGDGSRATLVVGGEPD